ncbi:hypothetical protein EV368DRAFT_90102 [Lentinula lateritia]|nr:hypothetical protein EV368DRAFT_90102 [Lentinula lateritia]
MSPVPVAALSNPCSNASPASTPPPPPNPPITTEEVDVEELASTVEDPPLGQLTLFKSVFGVGVSLARYIVDNPLWPILATAGLPCSFSEAPNHRGTRSVWYTSSTGSRQGPLDPEKEKADRQDGGGVLL